MEREGTVQAVSIMSGENLILQEGWVESEKLRYNYNEEILTFLFMGIDEKNKADAMFLLVLNPNEETVRLIPVNCNMMTAIDIYDEQGVYEDTISSQIGTQYGFGIGGKESCEYQVKAVRNLFYGIPISGYLAVDMEDVPKVMELIEKIDGISLENIKGLAGESRLERQSRILAELISQGKKLFKEDFTIPIRIYNEISGSAVTNITADEAAYLAATAGGYHFDAGQVIMIPGKSVGNEFYADKDALYELVLEVFYEPVNQER